MPKMKTHKSAAKRFSVSGSGRLKRSSAGRRHILTKKTTKRKREMRSDAWVAQADVGAVRKMLPNG
ncbi:MAG: 50S ribosomal protein L35 [Magnetococcales bacterium]|nr:50S ribosomal protein L35 [Magnetococcales bacterium]NGZ27132.1 50S ribosomal protein L35 [Magnetococcales bacterium]